LDYDEAHRFNRRCLGQSSPWLWVTSGPMSRGYVSPAILPESGPCLACLLRHFQRLSPVPELYDALIRQARCDEPIVPVPFPTEGIEILKQLVRWKAEQLAQDRPSSSLYRLHVLEVETMEITSHRVYPDPECPECGDACVV
jgi:bacteriocin biosynthesis cyclodehydratase domain-containing protein